MGMARFAGAAGLGLGLAAAAAGSSTMAAEADPSAYRGAWLAQGPDCTEVYSSGAKGPSFRKPLDLFAPAFIISGNRLRTPQASCRIKSSRPMGDRRLIVLDCANAVSSDDVKVLISTMPDGTLRRYFNEQDTTGTTYQRCSR